MSWQCLCGETMQSFRIINYRSCGRNKESGKSTVVKTGDWICSNCSENNFARRIFCHFCCAPKPKKQKSFQQSPGAVNTRTIQELARLIEELDISKAATIFNFLQVLILSFKDNIESPTIIVECLSSLRYRCEAANAEALISQLHQQRYWEV